MGKQAQRKSLVLLKNNGILPLDLILKFIYMGLMIIYQKN